MSVARDIEGDVDAVGAADARIDFVFEPVLRDHALHALHVPGEPISEIASAPGEAKPAIRPARIESNVGTTHGAALAERNLVMFGLWLSLRLGLLGHGFLLLFLLNVGV